MPRTCPSTAPRRPLSPLPTRPWRGALAPLLAALLAAPAAAQDGAALYATHCARCHGETGDGQGTEPLDRPARSFAAGGFSFGDTEEALVRTLTHGIPGSPMPAFGEATSEAERVALARHVATLMPPRAELLEGDMLLDVGEHPVVVRGHLPPIADGAPDHPRGLLVGLPSGFTFEYRVDDLALLGIRQGQLAKRTDWAGRGGTPLQPLGQVVWLNEGGEAGTSWSLLPSGRLPMSLAFDDLTAELVETSTNLGQAPAVTYRLADEAGQPVALVREELSTQSTTEGTAWRRRLLVTALVSGKLTLALDRTVAGHGLTAAEPVGPHATSWRILSTGARPNSPVDLISIDPDEIRGIENTLSAPRGSLHAVRRADGLVELVFLDGAGRAANQSSMSVRLQVDADNPAAREIVLVVLISNTWDLQDDARALALMEELH